MKTQVTQRRKLTLKSRAAAPAEAEKPMRAATAATVAGPIGGVDSSYHKLGFFVALAACVLVVVLIALQAMELTYFQGPLPDGPAFPVRGP